MTTPQHYDMKIQPVEFITKNQIPFKEANAIKYICRHSKKNKQEDIKKAIHYLEMILDHYEDNLYLKQYQSRKRSLQPIIIWVLLFLSYIIIIKISYYVETF